MVVNYGYPIEQENREYLRASQTDAKVLFMGDLPERCDPRKSALATDGWLKVENQYRQGSCEGQSLTETGEFCFTVATGRVIQLSRQYAYIASQMESNIKGDSGATLEGGTKAFLKGICREEIAPYAQAYPGWSYITAAMREDAKNYILKSHTEMKSAEHVKQFIGSGVGIVQLGISWNGSMEPDGNGCIRSWRSGGGGHAIVFAGYVPDSDLGVKSSAGWWLLLKNSWGTSWGKGGYAYVDPKACDQMLAHQWTSMYGRSDMETPNPRPLPVDFTKESVLG